MQRVDRTGHIGLKCLFTNNKLWKLTVAGPEKCLLHFGVLVVDVETWLFLTDAPYLSSF